MDTSIDVRLATLDDLDVLTRHLGIHDDESGTDGELPYGPYGRDELIGDDERRSRLRTRLARPLDQLDWRRFLIAVERGRCIGHAQIDGGGLAAERHRCTLGLGVERPWRRRGIGRRLMDEAITWARAQPGLDWMDLGVFVGNDTAVTIYEALGFERIGVTRDRFRVDGRSIDDLRMTLSVRPDGSA